MKAPPIRYRNVSVKRLFTPEYRHLLYLVYWPVYLIGFYLCEYLIDPAVCHPIHCVVDDWIPFCEWFYIPYVIWFAYFFAMLLYTLYYDLLEYRNMMKFIIVTYTLTVIIYIIFPNCQQLRPAQFERDNILTRLVTAFYSGDTNTNVCPSLHVIGSVSVMITGLRCRSLNRPLWKIFFIFMTALISISTLFMKQHSFIDVVAAIPVCLLGYVIAYIVWQPKKAKKDDA